MLLLTLLLGSAMLPACAKDCGLYRYSAQDCDTACKCWPEEKQRGCRTACGITGRPPKCP